MASAAPEKLRVGAMRAPRSCRSDCTRERLIALTSSRLSILALSFRSEPRRFLIEQKRRQGEVMSYALRAAGKKRV